METEFGALKRKVGGVNNVKERGLEETSGEAYEWQIKDVVHVSNTTVVTKISTW